MSKSPDLLDQYHQRIMELLESTTITSVTTPTAPNTTASTTVNVELTDPTIIRQWETLVSSGIILMAVLLAIAYQYCLRSRRAKVPLLPETTPDLSAPPRYEETMADKRREYTSITGV